MLFYVFSVAFFATYSICGMVVMKRIYSKLMDMDGNFSKSIKERQGM